METFNSELGTIFEVKNRMIETCWKFGSNLFFTDPKKRPPTIFPGLNRLQRRDLAEVIWSTCGSIQVPSPLPLGLGYSLGAG